MERPLVVFVVRGIIRTGNKILLLQRASTDSWATGLWELPGGKIDKGQGVEEAFEREILEETGLKVETRRPISIHDEFLGENNKYPNHLYVALFCESWTTDDMQVKLSLEHQQAEWLTLEQCRGRELTKGTLPAIETFFAIR